MNWEYRVLYDDDHWGVYEVLYNDMGRVVRRSAEPLTVAALQQYDLECLIGFLSVAWSDHHLKRSDVDAAIRGTGPQVFKLDNAYWAERERERQRRREAAEKEEP